MSTRRDSVEIKASRSSLPLFTSHIVCCQPYGDSPTKRLLIIIEIMKHIQGNVWNCFGILDFIIKKQLGHRTGQPQCIHCVKVPPRKSVTPKLRKPSIDLGRDKHCPDTKKRRDGQIGRTASCTLPTKGKESNCSTRPGSSCQTANWSILSGRTLCGEESKTQKGHAVWAQIDSRLR